MAIRTYPVKRASSAPGTGSILYTHLMENLVIPARSSHDIWYAGENAKLESPGGYSFRGAIPIGQTIRLTSLSGKPFADGETSYTFDGSEGPVLVSDLTQSARTALGIPVTARDKDKVFNPNFKKYEELDETTRFSNELAAMALPKSLSSYFGGSGRVNYSELDVLKFLTACFENLSGSEMMHVLHGNHMAWAALAYMRAKGSVGGDVSAEFYRAQVPDFYAKDLGTVLPAMFYAVALLGKNPIAFFEKLDTEVWSAKEVAQHMKQFSQYKPD